MNDNRLHTVILDGVTKVREEALDLDGDGKVGGVEKVSRKQEGTVHQAKESTELGDVMDKAFPSKQTDIINMLGNIREIETVNLFIIRSLVRLEFLPPECIEIAEEYIELSISRGARGRNDIRDISVGKKQFDATTGVQKMQNMMGVNREK